MHETRAGIQSVEVGFTSRDALARATGPLMPRDLGPAALHLRLASISRIDAVKLARERIGGWMREIGHTLALAVWGNRSPTIVHGQKTPSVIAVNLHLGDLMPLLRSATGRCFAAHTPVDAITPMLTAELVPQRKRPLPNTPVTHEEVQQLPTEVRTQGLARAEDNLQPALAGFCAPVFDFTGRMVMGIITLGAMVQFVSHRGSQVAQALRAAARRLSADAGHQA